MEPGDTRYQAPVSLAGMQNMMTGYGPTMGQSQVPTQGQQQEQNVSEHGDPRKQEIGDILTQIMNITDQSLDEAQAR